MRRWLMLASLLLFMTPAWAQSGMVSFAVRGGELLTDITGTLYVYDQDGVRSYAPDGSLRGEWQSAFGDEITSIDVSNPFKVLVFSEQASTITFLDQSLAPIESPLGLPDRGMEAPVAACTSYDNGLWVLDRSRGDRLFRYDKFLRLTQSSIIDAGLGLGPYYLIEEGNSLYLYTPDAGLLVFDRYGTLLMELPVPPVRWPCIRDGMIAGADDEGLVFIGLTGGQADLRADLPGSTTGFCLGSDSFLCCTVDSVHIFPLPRP